MAGKIFIPFIILFIYVVSASAQVSVSIPDTSFKSGKNIYIPIYVSDLTGQRVRSYSFKLKYDQKILKFRSVIDDNTLSDSWNWSINSDLEDDGLEVEARGWFSLSGSGTLLLLKFRVRGDEGFTDLIFDPFVFNDGKPSAQIKNGSFRIYSEKKVVFEKLGEGQGIIAINEAKYNLPLEIDLVQGEEYLLKAEPNENSIFKSWSGGINSENNPITYSVDEDVKIYLEFAIRKFLVSADVVPEGSGFVEGAGIYEYGEYAILSATPLGGKEFTGWTINGDLVQNDPEFELKVSGDIHVTANFGDLLYEINATSNPPEAGSINGIGYYYYNEEATLEAYGNESWQFDYWSEDGEFVSNDSLLVLMVEGSRVLTANFNHLTEIENEITIANKYFLNNPYPNPFNPSTTFRFGIKNPSDVSFYLFDLNGKVVDIIYSSEKINRGTYEKNYKAEQLASGVYFYYFQANDLVENSTFKKSGKLILLK